MTGPKKDVAPGYAPALDGCRFAAMIAGKMATIRIETCLRCPAPSGCRYEEGPVRAQVENELGDWARTVHGAERVFFHHGTKLDGIALGEQFAAGKDAGMQRKEMAELAGLTPSTVNRYMRLWREADARQEVAPCQKPSPVRLLTLPSLSTSMR